MSNFKVKLSTIKECRDDESKEVKVENVKEVKQDLKFKEVSKPELVKFAISKLKEYDSSYDWECVQCSTLLRFTKITKNEEEYNKLCKEKNISPNCDKHKQPKKASWSLSKDGTRVYMIKVEQVIYCSGEY